MWKLKDKNSKNNYSYDSLLLETQSKKMYIVTSKPEDMGESKHVELYNLFKRFNNLK